MIQIGHKMEHGNETPKNMTETSSETISLCSDAKTNDIASKTLSCIVYQDSIYLKKLTRLLQLGNNLNIIIRRMSLCFYV